MARSKGLLKIEGTLDGMTFYKSRDGHMVRSKGGIAKKRIETDSAFVRTRENMAEFKEAASAHMLVCRHAQFNRIGFLSTYIVI